MDCGGDLDSSTLHSQQSSPHSSISSDLTTQFEEALNTSENGHQLLTEVNSDTLPTTQHKDKKGTGCQEELCLICGDRASGYHYNALSCEGCKGFFRRSIARSAKYTCKTSDSCEMDMWMRRKCQACRLRRCKEVGMKEECLMSEEQCKARDARRKVRRQCSKESNSDSVLIKTEQIQDTSPDGVIDALNSEERQLIEKLVFNQEKYELPSTDDMTKLSELRICDSVRPTEVSEKLYKSMAEMTILVTQLVVEFAKRLPGFLSLSKDDQITQLKGSASEVMILRTARRYDLNTDTIIFGDGFPMSREAMRLGGLNSTTFVDDMFDFCRKMATLGVDNAEYSLLTALSILSDRSGLQDSSKVENLQELYSNVLMSYTKVRRRHFTCYFPSLLMKLTDLRNLSIEHAKVLFALKVEKGSLPPLLCEYFHVFEES